MQSIIYGRGERTSNRKSFVASTKSTPVMRLMEEFGNRKNVFEFKLWDLGSSLSHSVHSGGILFLPRMTIAGSSFRIYSDDLSG